MGKSKEDRLQLADIDNINTLLIKSDKTMKEVAALYGYSDSSAFVKGLRSLGYERRNCLVAVVEGPDGVLKTSKASLNVFR